MDLSNLIPIIAAHIGLAPSTLIFLIIVANQGAKVVSRAIPNDATGWRAAVRRVASVIGADTSSVVTTTADGKSVTVQDVAKAALATPPIPQKVETNTTQGV